VAMSACAKSRVEGLSEHRSERQRVRSGANLAMSARAKSEVEA
jgi:hypothetical protein